MITHLSQGGSKVRIRVQNEFGDGAVTIDRTAVALSAGGANIEPGSSKDLTFDGSASVTIPRGGEVWSDPVALDTSPQQDLAVSFFLHEEYRASLHDRAGRHNYGTVNGGGDHVDDASGASFTEDLPWTYYVSAVDVYNDDLDGTIVGYGSSVVDGTGSDNCGSLPAADCDSSDPNMRWTDDLARRVAEELPSDQQVAVVNEGIGGTMASPECNHHDLDGVRRLDRDVLALHGVTGLIYYYGTNDIQSNCDADIIIQNYRSVFSRLRAAGIKVFVTPITPRPGYSSEQNTERAAVNAFVRAGGDCSGTCDAVFDFDEVLRDPDHPNSITLAYDNGDGVHANVLGQRKIAKSIPLSDLADAGAPVITSADPSLAVAGHPYSFTVTAPSALPTTFSITSGALPAGLSLNPVTGEISGTPVAAGRSTVGLTASTGVGDDQTQTATITVYPALTAPHFTTTGLASGVVGEAYMTVLTATGSPSVTYTVTGGALPAGLDLDSRTGVISGTPKANGSQTVTVAASNGVGAPATSTLTVKVTKGKIKVKKKAKIKKRHKKNKVRVGKKLKVTKGKYQPKNVKIKYRWFSGGDKIKGKKGKKKHYKIRKADKGSKLRVKVKVKKKGYKKTTYKTNKTVKVKKKK